MLNFYNFPQKTNVATHRNFCKQSAYMIMFTLRWVLHSGVRAESECSCNMVVTPHRSSS